jgi:hypothetical protein
MKRPVALWTRYDDGSIDYCLVHVSIRGGGIAKLISRVTTWTRHVLSQGRWLLEIEFPFGPGVPAGMQESKIAGENPALLSKGAADALVEKHNG